MSWTGRNLRLLDINDRPDLKGLKYVDRFITISRIEHFSDALDAVLARRSVDGRELADLIFCDVNMEEHNNEHPKALLWNVTSGRSDSPPILAYGPLLSLPFLLAAPWTQFVPFSSYWADVKYNGYLVASVALILTMIEGKAKQTSEALEQIQKWIRQGGPIDSKNEIPRSIANLRKRVTELCDNGQLSLNGIDVTISQLEDWKHAAREIGFDKLDSERDLPLAINGEPICVEIFSSRNWDRLHVSSLFSDVLDFQIPATEEPINHIIEQLKKWTTLKNVIPWQNEQPYRIACQLLFEYLPESTEPDYQRKQKAFWKIPLQDRLVSFPGVKRGSDQYYFIIRLTMLFAFTRAWYLVRNHSYTANDIRELVFHFLGLNRPSKSGKITPETPFKRLLGETHGNTTLVGRGCRAAFKHPMQCLDSKTGEINTYAAYMLDADEPAALSNLEKSLCAKFVVDRIVYPIDDPDRNHAEWRPEHWPRWMRDDFKYNPDQVFNEAAETWENWADENGHRLFKSPFHHVEDWLKPPPPGSKKPKSDDQVRKDATLLLQQCGCHTDELDFVTAIKLLKSASESDRELPVSAAEAVLGYKSGSLYACKKETDNPKLCANNSAGRLASALFTLRSSIPDHLKKVDSTSAEHASPIWTLTFDRSRDVFIATETVEFESDSDASDAKRILDMTPQERMAQENRATPGQATLACYWLRKEAKLYITLTKPHGLSISIEFEAKDI